MKAADLKEFKEMLLAMRARLRGDVSTMADAALRRSESDGGSSISTMPIHMADLGSDAFEQEFTLALMATEEGTLDAVEEALERIRMKSFGLCEGCGGIITKKRLEAIPFAALCIKCAELEESNGTSRRPAVGNRPGVGKSVANRISTSKGAAAKTGGSKTPPRSSRPRRPR